MKSKILLITIVLTLSMQAQAEQVTKIIDNTKQLSKINYV